MSGDMISPVPTPRIDTVVADPASGEQRRRTDYAGTVWYGGRPQMAGGMLIGGGGLAQITSPFWLPDSHLYEPAAAGDAQVQASAAIQSAARDSQILEVSAALGEDPQNSAGLLVFVAVTAVASLPLGVSYRVTVVCRSQALQPPAT
jgi:hypothetical protein